MALVCNDCNVGIPIAKFYLAMTLEEDPGWFVPDDWELIETTNRFFQRHSHEYDKRISGGHQYSLRYEEERDLLQCGTWQYEDKLEQ